MIENINNSEIKKSNIIKMFMIYYVNCHDVVIDKNIINLIDDTKNIPRMINISKLNYIKDNIFINIPEKLNKNNFHLCDIGKKLVNIVIKNNNCNHCISLYTYIKIPMNECVVCNSSWNIKNCYIVN